MSAEGDKDPTPAERSFTVVPEPHTTITSTLPTYLSHEAAPPVEFSADIEGSTFQCKLDSGAWAGCTSPHTLPEHLEGGWHTFEVKATDPEGFTDPTPATWTFNTEIYAPVSDPESKLTAPEAGRKSGGYYTLQAHAGSGITAATFQVKLPSWGAFKTIPAEYVLDAEGKEAKWPLAASGAPGDTPSVYFDARAFMEAEGAGPIVANLQLRAVFDGTKAAAGASEPVAVTYSRFGGGPGDATESVGPATVDLLTGSFTITRTDVSIPVPGAESNLEFTRTYSSAWGANESTNSKTLGQMWQPSAPVESEYEEEAWQKLLVQHRDAVPPKYEEECWEEKGEYGEIIHECEKWMSEVEIPAADWVEVLDSEGAGIPFDRVGAAEPYTYVAPEEAKEFKLTKSGVTFALTDPNGTTTEFSRNGETNEYVPSAIAFAAGAKEARLVYQIAEGKKRLYRIIAPAPAGVTCNPFESEGNYAPTTPGCRSLFFTYTTINGEGRLEEITYYDATGSGTGHVVAQYGYDAVGNLVEEWDPRISPALKETYAYESPGEARLSKLTPPGVEPWELAYYPAGSGGAYEAKLKSVSRASLIEAEPTATSTIVYGVPLSGAGAPYEMSSEAVAAWDEHDYPVAATAVFPPTEVPGEPPSDYSQATIRYMDPDGYEVNTASPSPPGVEGHAITTSEFDAHGNVVRSLDAKARLEALEAEDPIARSHQLDSHSAYRYGENGARTIETQSWGPLHQIRLASTGETVEARSHTTVKNDQGFEHKEGETWPNLSTEETSGVVIAGKEGEYEATKTETHYDWTLRKPIEEIIDPGGLNLHTVTVYEESTGLPIETRSPANPEGGDAHSTKTIYYSAGTQSPLTGCQNKPAWANLPCMVEPAAQASPAESNPELLVTRYAKYSSLDQPEEIIESPGGGNSIERRTFTTYDAGGRVTSMRQEGGGKAFPATETIYSETTGAAVEQRLACEAGCGNGGMGYLSSFGGTGTGNGELEHPAGVAAEANGDVWVVDQDNNRVEKFNEEGEYLMQFGSYGTGNGQFHNPSGIAIDPEGHLWVADANNNRIEEFNKGGEYLSQFGSSGTEDGQLRFPYGLAIDAEGNIWVADTANNRIQEFSQKGAFIRKVGHYGRQEGDMIEPAGIAVAPSGNVWVADRSNSRVDEFSASGSFIREVGSSGSGDGQFDRPDAIETDSEGNIWVGDPSYNRIQEFNSSGEYLGKFGSSGSGPGQFSLKLPAGIATAGGSDLWIVDGGNDRVQRWTRTEPLGARAVKTTYDALGRPTKYEDADGNVSETTYDLLGRPVLTTDGKGAQLRTYDSTSGALVKLEDSAAGTFTAAYNADGQMTEQLRRRSRGVVSLSRSPFRQMESLLHAARGSGGDRARRRGAGTGTRPRPAGAGREDS